MDKTKINKFSCYFGYISQSFVNNYLPLLYVMIYYFFKIDLARIALFGVVNFIVQLITDILSPKLINKIGYRKCGILAHVLILIGFSMFLILPNFINPFFGIMISICIYAIGGGLDEVIISPIMEAQPYKNKHAQLGVLHAMYCFGSVYVIVASALFFIFFGVDNYVYLTMIHMSIPLITTVLFIFSTSDVEFKEEVKTDNNVVLKNIKFLLLFVLMICAGATEQSIAQWSSTYAELFLHVNKPFGDLYGFVPFMVFMGLSRIVYSFISEKVKLSQILFFAGIICIVGYLFASLSTISALNFLGCMIVGIGVGPLWPSVFSYSLSKFDSSPKLFSLLSLGGDIGCGLGTYVVGAIASIYNISIGISWAIIFPIVLCLSILILQKKN